MPVYVIGLSQSKAMNDVKVVLVKSSIPLHSAHRKLILHNSIYYGTVLPFRGYKKVLKFEFVVWKKTKGSKIV